MKQLLKDKLKVDYGQLFEIKGYDERFTIYRIHNKEVDYEEVLHLVSQVSPNNFGDMEEREVWAPSSEWKKKLENDIVEVIKFKFKPSYANYDYYYVFSNSGDNELRVGRARWLNRSIDYARYYVGNCFRSEDEARRDGQAVLDIVNQFYNAKIMDVYGREVR